jgi:hypothetical protein
MPEMIAVEEDIQRISFLCITSDYECVCVCMYMRPRGWSWNLAAAKNNSLFK